MILKITTTGILNGTDEWRAWTSSAIEAMNYIIAEDIRVSNNSWGSPYASDALHDIMVAAQTGVTGGHIFVAAAGNATTDLDNVRECIGGSKDNHPCDVDAECLFCDDPANQPCTTDDDCNPGGTCGECRYNASRCVGGLNDGEMCSEDADCRFCTDPSGDPCTVDGDCNSGTCGDCPFKRGGRCFDGSNFDLPGCDDDSDCDSEEICIYVDVPQCTGPPCGKRIYPCTWNIPNMICVASVAQNGDRYSDSNWGATRVDLGAPGENIPTTGLDHTYTTWAATSAAAPHVAGVVGLVIAYHPYVPADPPQEEQWGWSQVKDAVLLGVRPISDLVDKTVTGGMVNALDALDGNSNGEIDRCEVPNCPTECQDWYNVSCGSEPDCTGVGIPDDAKPDCDDNGIADDCEVFFTSEVVKNRYISIDPGSTSEETAIRVTLLDPPEGYSVQMWVGTPVEIPEKSGLHEKESGSTTFNVAQLVDDRVFMDWSTIEGVVDVRGPEILPGYVYRVQAVREECLLLIDLPSLSYNKPLDIPTSEWGDVAGDVEGDVWTPPDGIVDFMDISAVLGKFKNEEIPPAIRKARADLQSAIGVPYVGNTDEVDDVVDFNDIMLCVDAFRRIHVPFIAYVLPDPPTSPCE